ncbi:MAG TPA: transglycosylase domain-containing protein [Solirubrobacteraceae bacterium]
MPELERHPGADVIPLHPGPPSPPPPRARVRIKKLRLLALLTGLGILAAVSAAFGMMMAVAADLPEIDRLELSSKNSVVEDRTGRRLGILTGAQNRILLRENEIPVVMTHAIIAIEDQRFLTHPGVDLQGTARALYQDVVAGGAVQGGSTITQQFVKNATAAQSQRTLLNKVREAALAFHISRKWSKAHIMRNYLNSIYFGNGAYGLEAAARTYFGYNHDGCDSPKPQVRCASQLLPAEAAMLAGVVASPSMYDPLAHPKAARGRRDVVLGKMREQGYLDAGQYATAIATPLPVEGEVRPPQEETPYPYFTSWVKQQIVDELGGGSVGARRAFEGGLRIRTTIDSRLQEAAETSVQRWLSRTGGPEAAMVVLDNRTGEVRAMVGGPSERYADRPFNLATQGQRQPGSAFKPFVLAQALSDGISPNSTWVSSKQTIRVPRSSEKFVVNNYENAYSGVTTLARATTFSDNSVYAQVGVKVGTRRIASLARRMGIRTDVSTNYAMTLGGLRQGVTPLDLAHAYLTFASRGQLVYGTMSPDAGRFRGGIRNVPGPPGISAILRGDGKKAKAIKLPNGHLARNRVRERRILSTGVADQVSGILQTVTRDGTGKRAWLGPDQLSAGKTGTTEEYSDAWFAGWSRRYTVAVWVGYPDGFRPMKTEWQGEPVAGGTYPAAIWHDFMTAAFAIYPEKRDDEEDDAGAESGTAPPAAASPAAPAAGATPAPATQAAPTPAPAAPAPAPSGGGTGGTGGTTAPAPQPAPEPQAPPAQSAPAPEAEGGGTAGGGGGAAAGDGTPP